MDSLIKTLLTTTLLLLSSSFATASNGACISRQTAVDIATTNILKDYYFDRRDEALLDYATEIQFNGEDRYYYTWPISTYSEAYIEVTCRGVFTFDSYEDYD